MSSVPEAVPPAPASACPLCETEAAPTVDRCPECGYALAGVGGRPGPYSSTTAWATALGLVAIYLAALVVVLLAR